MVEKVKIVFLDRDGTLNEDFGYISDPLKVVLCEGVAQALVSLRRVGYRVVVVSNQSAVGRGICSLETIEAVNTRLNELLIEQNSQAVLDIVLFCPHHPDQGCACRKPKLGMLANLPPTWSFDPLDCWVVGDKESDMEFGANVAIPAEQRILLVKQSSAFQKRNSAEPPMFVELKNFKEAAEHIIAQRVN